MNDGSLTVLHSSYACKQALSHLTILLGFLASASSFRFKFGPIRLTLRHSGQPGVTPSSTALTRSYPPIVVCVIDLRRISRNALSRRRPARL